MAGSAAGLSTTATAGAHPAEPVPPSAVSRPAAGYAFSFLSSPDFLNNDIADVSAVRGYQEGSPNSYNAYYARALDTVLDTFQAEGVPSLLVAGDLVEGHWWVDTADTGTFGGLDTAAGRKQVVRQAGDLYYGAWDDMVRSHGLRPYPALGDHEIGDNPWHPYQELFRQKHALIPTFKSVFGRTLLRDARGRQRYRDHPRGPARDTAYATRLHPEVQLVTVDVFNRTRRNVAARIDRKQLAWVESVLRKARADGVDWIIVQGHTPVVGPVRVADNSSGIAYDGGTRSAFWKLLRKYDVNAYLAGEMHATTAGIDGGVAQIVHGATFASGRTNYLRVDVTKNRLHVVAKQLTGYTLNPRQLWGMDERKSPPGAILYLPGARVVGTMDITRQHRLRDRTGVLTPYGASRR